MSSLIIIIFFAAPIFAVGSGDSLWVHIKSVAEHNEGERWRAVNVEWQVFVKEFDEKSGIYLNWRESETDDSLQLSYFAQCALDSTFSSVVSAGTTEANSFTFSGVPQKTIYFVRATTVDEKNPVKWDFAVGGINKGKKAAQDRQRFLFMIGISLVMMVAGIVPIIIVAISQKKKRQIQNID